MSLNPKTILESLKVMIRNTKDKVKKSNYIRYFKIVKRFLAMSKPLKPREKEKIVSKLLDELEEVNRKILKQVHNFKGLAVCNLMDRCDVLMDELEEYI